jgi:hypothetical protein
MSPKRRKEMGRNDGDDDREKPSWREIDKMRDHSRHVSREPKSYRERSLRSEWAKKQHLKEAEKFFLGKKGTEEYKKAYASLHDKYGSPGFEEAAKKFIQEFGPPDDWGTLLLLLDVKDPALVQAVLAPLKELYGKRSPIEQKGLKGKLKILVITAKEKALREEAEKMLQGL